MKRCVNAMWSVESIIILWIVESKTILCSVKSMPAMWSDRSMLAMWSVESMTILWMITFSHTKRTNDGLGDSFETKIAYILIVRHEPLKAGCLLTCVILYKCKQNAL